MARGMLSSIGTFSNGTERRFGYGLDRQSCQDWGKLYKNNCGSNCDSRLGTRTRNVEVHRLQVPDKSLLATFHDIWTAMADVRDAAIEARALNINDEEQGWIGYDTYVFRIGNDDGPAHDFERLGVV